MLTVRNQDLGNLLLRSLLARGADGIRRHLEPVELVPGKILYHAGERIEHLYFINRGLVARLTVLGDGRAVEVGALSEGLVDIFALHGFERAVCDYIVQIPGTAFRIHHRALQDEVSQCEEASVLLRLYAQEVLSSLVQTAACQCLHSLQQRCCRWLLTARDGAHSDSFRLTHESLALMLGVRRAGVSTIAGTLQGRNLIHYRRGHVTIVDRRGLEKLACECYATVRGRLDRLLIPDFDPR